MNNRTSDIFCEISRSLAAQSPVVLPRVTEVLGCFQVSRHKEALGARIARGDLPMWHTEYRMLTMQLEVSQTCFNKVDCFDIVLPLRQNCFQLAAATAARKPVDERSRWRANRYRFVLHADGLQNTFVLISPEEFDLAMAQWSDAGGAFAAYPFTGSELYSAPDLYEREKMASLAAGEEGRRRLHALADDVVSLFRLPAPPAPGPGPASASPSLSQVVNQ